MSYCRFADNSDVYLYLSNDGWECCGCSLNNGELLLLKTPWDALGHLKEHVSSGDQVPAQSIVDLATDVEVVRVTLRSLGVPASIPVAPERIGRN
jgi:hypothetical protein